MTDPKPFALPHSLLLLLGLAAVTLFFAAVGLVCLAVLHRRKRILAPALGHSYGEPSWTWSEDNSLALATFLCPVCGDAKICIAEISEEVILEPAPHVPGEKKLTATVVFNGETYTDEKLVPIEATAHDCPCALFEDMPAFGTPEHEAIDWAYVNGITTGMDETHFGTGTTLTRAQTAAFMWAANGKPEIDEANFANPFSDVKAGKWYTKYVLWAADEGLVSGYEDGTFRPSGTLNRGEILTLLYAMAGKPSVAGIENPYSDVAPGKWYEAPALWAYDKGIERGEDGVFARNTLVLRETFVLYLYRCMEGKCLDE